MENKCFKDIYDVCSNTKNPQGKILGNPEYKKIFSNWCEMKIGNETFASSEDWRIDKKLSETGYRNKSNYPRFKKGYQEFLFQIYEKWGFKYESFINARWFFEEESSAEEEVSFKYPEQQTLLFLDVDVGSRDLLMKKFNTIYKDYLNSEGTVNETLESEDKDFFTSLNSAIRDLNEERKKIDYPNNTREYLLESLRARGYPPSNVVYMKYILDYLVKEENLKNKNNFREDWDEQQWKETKDKLRKLRSKDKKGKFWFDLSKIFIEYDENSSSNKGDENMGKEKLREYLYNKILKNLAENPVKQVIFHGAPGTGKTYTVREEIKKHIAGYKDVRSEKEIEAEVGDKEDVKELAKELAKERYERELKKYYEFVQFHSSYDYTDFVEGLRPVEVEGEGDKGLQFKKIDGIFKAFCRKVVENNDNKKYFFIIDEINRADLSKVFGELMFSLEESYRGTGNSITTQYQNLPSYKYVSLDENDEEVEIDAENVVKSVAREIRPDVFKGGFYIPENVYIIGTMNDIDRSVESFDFALRRRFQWFSVDADTEMEEALMKMFEVKEDNNDLSAEGKKDKKASEIVKDLSGKIKKMNVVISDGLGKKLGLNKSYHIGHAYFKAYNGENEESKKESLEDIWNNRVKSLLEEYCRGRDKDKVDEFIKKCGAELGIVFPKAAEENDNPPNTEEEQNQED